MGVILVLFAAPVLHKQARQAFFGVEKRNGVWWLITPEGKPFFSSGVDVADRGAKREKYKSDRPEYGSFRYYSDDASWANSALSRLRKWGFNTIGAWGDSEALCKASEPMMPYTVGLWMGSYAGVPWHDLFGPDAKRIFDREAKKICEPRKDDPLLIGYFTDNELGWWDETMFLFQLKRRQIPLRRPLCLLVS